jgi:heptaprenyl diphosphate synthase
LQLADHFMPKIPLFPWLKLGLSHLVVLPFLLRYGAMPALALGLGRNLLTFMVAGTPLTSVMVGMFAVLVSVGLVGALLRPLVRYGLLGWVGLGIASALAHNGAQLALVEWLLVGHTGFYFQLAPLILWSLISGTLMALLAAAAMPFWNRLFDASHFLASSGSVETVTSAESGNPAKPNHLALWAWLSLVGLTLVLSQLETQALLFLCTALITFKTTLYSGFRPLRGTWALLVLMAWLHLFNGEGHYIEWPAWLAGLNRLGMTREGWQQFGIAALRLLTLALAGPQVLRHLPRDWLAQSSSTYVRGLCLALPALLVLPAKVPAALRQARLAGKNKDQIGTTWLGLRFNAALSVFAEMVLTSAKEPLASAKNRT